jgi:L-fuculose-phosphate aldolase
MEPAAELAIARRVGRRLDLVDVDGHVSMRVDERTVLVTPAPGAVAPARLNAADVVRVQLDGEVQPGAPHAVPAGVALDLALYRARPDVRSIATGSPLTGMAFGSVGRDVLPLTHSWAEYAHGGAAWLDGLPVVADLDVADAAARLVGARPFVHLPGVAVLALGAEPIDAVRRLHALDYLARLSALATDLSPSPVVVTEEQARDIDRQRPWEAVPSRDYRRYYHSLDREPPVVPAVRWPQGNDEGRIRRDVAVSCRLLGAAELAAFFEHVSHRIPGRPDRFAMSPAKDFNAMTPDDVGIVSTEGDCPTLSGPIPAAPFRWYHRDLLERRPDVMAIVHSHELAGRAFILAGAAAPPVHRYAVRGLAGGMPPIFRTPSLVFSEEHRRQVLDLLGDGPWVHAIAHGTDFVADDIRVATVRAICWDRHLRFTVLARGLGEPRGLDAGALAALGRHTADEAAWWDDLVDALPA